MIKRLFQVKREAVGYSANCIRTTDHCFGKKFRFLRHDREKN